jgi:glucose/arabinose dehydrogenase
MVFKPGEWLGCQMERLLVTEKSGTLYQIKKAQNWNKNVPAGIIEDKEDCWYYLGSIYAKNSWIYITYSLLGRRREEILNLFVTKVLRRRFDADWVTIQIRCDKGQHFGSRWCFDKEGFLLVSRRKNWAFVNPQDHSQITEKYTVWMMMAFKTTLYGQENKETIYTYGSKKPQGLAWKSIGRCLGTRARTEGRWQVKRYQKTANYGWPVVTYGIDYDGHSSGYSKKELKIPFTIRFLLQAEWLL